MSTSSLPRPVPHPAEAASPPGPAVGLIVALVEALSGRRPLHQVRPHLSRTAFDALAAYADSGSFRSAPAAGLRAQMPTPRAVEATLRLGTSARWISCVLRLERLDDAWQCTEVAVLAPSWSALRAA